MPAQTILVVCIYIQAISPISARFKPATSFYLIIIQQVIFSKSVVAADGLFTLNIAINIPERDLYIQHRSTRAIEIAMIGTARNRNSFAFFDKLYPYTTGFLISQT